MLSALIIATQWRPPALPYRTISHLLCTQACSSLCLCVFAAAAQRARQHGSACCMRKLLQTLAIAMLLLPERCKSNLRRSTTLTPCVYLPPGPCPQTWGLSSIRVACPCVVDPHLSLGLSHPSTYTAVTGMHACTRRRSQSSGPLLLPACLLLLWLL